MANKLSVHQRPHHTLLPHSSQSLSLTSLTSHTVTHRAQCSLLTAHTLTQCLSLTARTCILFVSSLSCHSVRPRKNRRNANPNKYSKRNVQSNSKSRKFCLSPIAIFRLDVEIKKRLYLHLRI